MVGGVTGGAEGEGLASAADDSEQRGRCSLRWDSLGNRSLQRGHWWRQ